VIFAAQRARNGGYGRLQGADTPVMAKTSLFSPELRRIYVAVPHLGGTLAKVLVFLTE